MSSNKNVALAWPAGAESSVGAVGWGELGTHGAQTRRPTASVAKLITALTVLQKYPLSPGQNGPIITLTNADVAIYNKYVSKEGSVARVVVGEQITERQALEAMMLPSANNVADSLAIWAYGSLSAYNRAASSYIKTIGLDNTVIGQDASGFLPSTVSTSHDLLLLGFKVLQNPALKQIVAEPTAKLPVTGKVSNVNWLLGSDGIIGIKTGDTNQAGGVYIFAASDNVMGTNVTIVGVVQGSKTLPQAVNAAVPLLDSAKSQFGSVTLVKKDQPVATYELPWGGSVRAVAAGNLKTISWGGNNLKPVISIKSINPGEFTGYRVGSICSPMNNKDCVPVILSSSVLSPKWGFKIIHPFKN